MAEFTHKTTGEVLGAEDGSMLERRLARNPDWGRTSETPKISQSSTRDELNDHATELGIEDPESFKTKGDLWDAIQEASGEPSE